VYLLGIESLSEEAYQRMVGAYEFYLDGLEAALTESEAEQSVDSGRKNPVDETNSFLVGGILSIADISFVCDFAQFLREGHYQEVINRKGFDLISTNLDKDYPLALKHLLDLSELEEFSKVMGTYLNWYKRN